MAANQLSKEPKRQRDTMLTELLATRRQTVKDATGPKG